MPFSLVLQYVQFYMDEINLTVKPLILGTPNTKT